MFPATVLPVLSCPTLGLKVVKAGPGNETGSNMKLAAHYDIEAPVDFVYRQLTDYEAWESLAMRRGAEVTRTDIQTRPDAATGWQVSFQLRGKNRKFAVKIAHATLSSQLSIAMTSALFHGEIVVNLLDLSAQRTRVAVTTVVKAKTLPARLYLQTLRLARKRANRSFAHRIAQLAVELEDRHRRPINRTVFRKV